MDFAKHIQQIRMSRNMSQVDFAKKIGVTQVAVHGWEAGTRKPQLEILRRICMALDISADTLLDLPPRGYDEVGRVETNETERSLLKTYRLLDDFGRDAVDLIARHEKSRVDFRAGAIANFKTADGERYIPKYLNAAAAGLAAPIDEADFELVRVDNNVPEGADYAVVISGKSMEPYIRDGGTVFVQKTDELQIGEIGIFSVDGATVCKMLYKTGLGDIYLVSANPEEQESNVFVPRDSTDTVICLGRVLLKKPRVLPDYFMSSVIR